MAAITLSTCAMSLSPSPPLLSISNLKSSRSSLNNTHTFLSLKTTPTHSLQNLLPTRTQFWRIYAAPEEALSTATTPVEITQEVVSSAGDDGAGSIVSVLLFAAFVVLSVLTIGVIYLGVSDFLERREREKLDKEEASKMKQERRKRRVRARAGPRGFGQKIYDDEEEET